MQGKHRLGDQEVVDMEEGKWLWDCGKKLLHFLHLTRNRFVDESRGKIEATETVLLLLGSRLRVRSHHELGSRPAEKGGFTVYFLLNANQREEEQPHGFLHSP